MTIDSYVRSLYHPASISALQKMAAGRNVTWLAARQIDSSVLEGMMKFQPKVWMSTPIESIVVSVNCQFCAQVEILLNRGRGLC